MKRSFSFGIFAQALLFSSFVAEGCDGSSPGGSPSVREAATADLVAWQASPYKTCSLDAVLPSLPAPPTGARPTPSPVPAGWDPAALRATHGDNLVLRSPSEPDRWAIFTGFDAGPERATSTNEQRTRRDGEETLVAKLAFEGGRCRVELDGEVVADLPLWGLARLGASMTPGRAFTSGFEAEEVDLTQRAQGEPEDSWFAIPRVASAHHFLDLEGFPRALHEALLPSSGVESTGHSENVARILGVPADLIEDALVTEPVLYSDLFLVDGSLPDLVTRASRGGAYRAPYVLSEAELAALDAASALRFEWVYAREDASSSARFEIILDRRAGAARAYDLAEVRFVSESDGNPADAATCIAMAVARSLTTLSAGTPRGSSPGTGDATDACADLGRPFITHLAMDAAASANVLALVEDATRAGYAHTPVGELTPSDGGASYETGFTERLLVPLFAELARTSSGLARLDALDSRIADGFAASVRALGAETFDATVRDALYEAAAARAFQAARARANADESYAPLTENEVVAAAAILGSGPAPVDFVREVTAMIRNGEPFAGDAAVACALSGTLDPLRAELVALETSVRGAEATWVRNVFLALMRWGSPAANVSPSDPAYCETAFVAWAGVNVGASPRPCSYQGVPFDTNLYCD